MHNNFGNEPSEKWAIATGILLSNQNKNNIFFATFCKKLNKKKNLFESKQNTLSDKFEDTPPLNEP